MKRLVPLILTASFLSSSATLAQRPIPHTLQDPKLSPEQQAAEHYYIGEEAAEKATRIESELAELEDGARPEKLEKKLARAWKKAIRHFSKAIESYPEMYKAHWQLGRSYHHIHRYEEALASCDRAIEIAPNLNEAILTRTRVYLALGRTGGAMADYTTLARRNPDLAAEALESISAWLELRRNDPEGVADVTLDELQTWIDGL